MYLYTSKSTYSYMRCTVDIRQWVAVWCPVYVQVCPFVLVHMCVFGILYMVAVHHTLEWRLMVVN